MATQRSRSFKSGFTLRNQSGWVQAPPFDQPLRYKVYGGTDRFSGSLAKDILPANWLQPTAGIYIEGYGGDTLRNQAYAVAYDRLIAKVKGEANAMLAVNVAERGQAYAMITARAMQLLAAYRALKNLNLKGFLTTLGFRFRKTRKSRQWVRVGRNGRVYTLTQAKVDRDANALRFRVKTAGRLWLEYWFGWRPLIGDIYSAIEVLQGIPPTEFRRSFSATGFRSSSSSKASSGSDFYSMESYTREYRCRAQATVVVTNSNLNAATKLGLINPATVLWELIPFSFLIDWFLPVSRFLESQTDIVGLSIKDPQIARKEIVSFSQNMGRYLKSPNPETLTTASHAYQFERLVLGALPIPGLTSRRGTGLGSATRAATAVSLLTRFLTYSK